MGNKLEKNAALLGLGAFLLLSFAVIVTVALPLMQSDLYEASASAPRYQGLDNDGKEISEKVAQGRQIYMREGCWYCHTQQVRTIDNDKAFRAPAATLKDGTQVGDRPTRPSDYGNDNPALLGTERTGPDLKYVAHRWPSKEWHIAHLIDPRSTEPNSIMPAFGHLPAEELDALAEYLLSLRDWAIPIKSFAKYPGPDLLAATDEIVPEEYLAMQNPFKLGDPAATARAEKLIQDKGCLGCHGQDMRGKDPSKGWANAPYPTDWYASAEKHSEQFIYWIISEGTLKEDGTPSGMPAWRTMGLSDEDRWALTTYIKGLAGK
ncbi:MAG: cbb3-type cytochrome c oxidase subunit II [Bacillota bacterium]